MSWGPIKCKDYFIIKLRSYASPYYLKQFHEGKRKGHIKHMEAAQNYHNFFWRMIEKITEKPEHHFHYEYFMHAGECAKEEIFETHGIYEMSTSGYYIFMIPKIHTDIIDWIINNVDIPHKVISKTNMGGWMQLTPDTWRREDYKTSDELKEKLKKSD